MLNKGIFVFKQEILNFADLFGVWKVTTDAKFQLSLSCWLKKAQGHGV